MSTHPNVILMAVLTPDGLTRKTWKEILEDNVVKSDNYVIIYGNEYNSMVMETDYHKGFQIAGDEGDIVFFDFVTYGFGDSVTWDELEKRKTELETWAKETSARHHCNFKILVSANYW